MTEFPLVPRPTADWRRHVCRIASVIVLGAVLAGCDKCGDWWSPMRGESQTCRDQAPKPQ